MGREGQYCQTQLSYPWVPLFFLFYVFFLLFDCFSSMSFLYCSNFSWCYADRLVTALNPPTLIDLVTCIIALEQEKEYQKKQELEDWL